MIIRFLRSFLDGIENLKFLLPNHKPILAMSSLGFLAIYVALIIDHDFILRWGIAILSYTSVSSIVYLKWKEKAPTWIHYVGLGTFLLLIAILTVTSDR